MAARVEYQEIAMVLLAEKIGSTKVVAASRTLTAPRHSYNETIEYVSTFIRVGSASSRLYQRG